MAITKYAIATHISSTIVITVKFHNNTIKFLKVLPTFRIKTLWLKIFILISFSGYEIVIRI